MQTAEENYLFVGASARLVITTSGEDIRAVSWTLALELETNVHTKVPFRAFSWLKVCGLRHFKTLC